MSYTDTACLVHQRKKMSSREQILEEIARHPRWRHRIALPCGVVTPGTEDTEAELRRLDLPADMSGMRILDVGCSDGYFSFECERRGARSVIAIDDCSSGLASGTIGLPIAARLLGSNVSYQQMSVYDLNPNLLGQFDLILFLNVLYHLRHPLLGLDRIRSVMAPGASLYIKSYCHYDFVVTLFGRTFAFNHSSRPMAHFYPAGELGGDSTNWWGPTPRCLHAMVEASGISVDRKLAAIHDRVYLQCRRID